MIALSGAINGRRPRRMERSGRDRTGLAAGRGVELLEQPRAWVDADRRDAAFVVAEHGQALAVGEQPLHESVVVAVEAQQPESLDRLGLGLLAEDEARADEVVDLLGLGEQVGDQDRGRELRAPPAVEVLDQPLSGGLLEQEPGLLEADDLVAGAGGGEGAQTGGGDHPRDGRAGSELRIRIASAIISRRTAWPMRSSSESSLFGVPGSGRGSWRMRMLVTCLLAMLGGMRSGEAKPRRAMPPRA